MRDDVQKLLNLQKIDNNIVSLKAELVKIPKQQEAAKDRLANDTAAVAAAKKGYQENEVQIKNVELDVRIGGTAEDSFQKLPVPCHTRILPSQARPCAGAGRSASR